MPVYEVDYCESCSPDSETRFNFQWDREEERTDYWEVVRYLLLIIEAATVGELSQALHQFRTALHQWLYNIDQEELIDESDADADVDDAALATPTFDPVITESEFVPLATETMSEEPSPDDASTVVLHQGKHCALAESPQPDAGAGAE
jgi:hypothetical protein